MWLRFFRVVNLPTVPGDVLAGAAAVMAALSRPVGALPLAAACAAGVFLYMFGLADNDIVGAPTDVGRPVADGQISLRAARIARGICLFAAMVAGAAANLAPAWWVAAFLLAVAVVVYNRTKWCLAMGLCRGLNVICGAGMALPPVVENGAELTPALVASGVCAAVWTVYITAVTKYSEGEELDADRKRRVGFLIGAIVYLQLLALLVFGVKPLLVAGAVLLVVLRFSKRLLPKVSAS